MYIIDNMNTKIRKDYKIQRNQKIYAEYTNSDTSFNKLAKKFDLTPQRIQAIVKDIKTKGLEITLKGGDPKKKREKLKNHAVELRESGKIIQAIELFEQILKWDSTNGNLRGQIDILGHLSICYHLTAEKSDTKQARKKLLTKARGNLKESLSLIKQHKLPKGLSLTINAHLASNGLRLAEVVQKPEKGKFLGDALKCIDIALEGIPGSKAHKAWFLQTKARIQHLMNDSQSALDTLKDAENALYSGYKEEIDYKDQARLKLHVWTAGIDLTYAAIYKDTGRKILAEHKVASVLGLKDPERVLTQQKRKAREILESL